MILITGGAGSIGSALVEKLLNYPIRVLRCIDVDEYNLFRLKRCLKDERLRLLLGDVTDRERVKLALQGVDGVFHLAAIKNIEVSEYNCPQCIRVNVDGTVNMIECAFESKPKRFLYISSDKSVEPSTLYGGTKFLGERVTLWANRIQDETWFSVARFPNVRETRGNVFEIWRNEESRGEALSVTHKGAWRYMMGLEDAVEFLIEAYESMKGGEIFVPVKIEKTNIYSLASERSPNVKIVGLRAGEKLQEELFTSYESGVKRRRGNLWVV